MQDLGKLLLMNAAAVCAHAVCADTEGDNIPIDLEFKNTNLTNKNVMVYECAKIHYHALLRAFQDDTGVWPDPKVDFLGGVDLPGLIAKLPPGLLETIMKILGNVGSASPAPSTPATTSPAIPSP